MCSVTSVVKYILRQVLVFKAVNMILKSGFTLLLFFTAAVAAQEPPVAAEPDGTEAQVTEDEQVTGEVTEAVPEIIESTEEISEDYSIEFPVDI